MHVCRRKFPLVGMVYFKTQIVPFAENAILGPPALNQTHDPANLARCPTK